MKTMTESMTVGEISPAGWLLILAQNQGKLAFKEAKEEEAPLKVKTKITRKVEGK